MIRKFEKQELIVREVADEDNRNMHIHLTNKGMALFHELNDRSNQQIDEMLAKLEMKDREKLVNAMRVVKKYLTITKKNIIIRPYREEDIPYVIDRQLSLYESERQFTSEIWKNYLTQGVLSLVDKFDAARDSIFILECDGNAAGCAAITHTEENVAQLRYFFLEPEMRGLGVGTKLLNQALDFCREKQYAHVFLWTVSAQESARLLYGKAGFCITKTSESSDWGATVLEERWDMDL